MPREANPTATSSSDPPVPAVTLSPSIYRDSPETTLVSLSKTGDRQAFGEIVARRQSWLRNLLRRCCNNNELADDLAQQSFLLAWKNIRQLQNPKVFGAWLKRSAINEWLQYVRKNDPLRYAAETVDTDLETTDKNSLAIDLDDALASLPDTVRLCVVLAYHERMTHPEISELLDLPEGTVKSHIRRGSQKLRQELEAYRHAPGELT